MLLMHILCSNKETRRLPYTRTQRQQQSENQVLKKHVTAKKNPEKQEADDDAGRRQM